MHVLAAEQNAVVVNSDGMALEVFPNPVVDVTAFWITCDDGIVLKVKDAFLQCMMNINMIVREDCEDQKAVSIVTKGKLLYPVKTVVILSVETVG